MTMAQRTSSAVELNQRPPAPTGFAESSNPEFKFEPSKEPVTSWFYLKNQSKTVHGDWSIIDGFYLDSHGNRPAIAVLVYSKFIEGTFAEEVNIPSHITKTGQEVYFLNREMAEYCVKKMLESGESLKRAKEVCHGKSYNDLVDQLEERDQSGNFEDGMALAINVEQPDGKDVRPVMIGLVEMLVDKKLRLVHVVAELERTAKNLEHLKLHDRLSLIEPDYYASEAVARFAYKDRVRGNEPMTSLVGRSYEEMAMHLQQNAK